jgi:superfamily I DNA/RNA helicase
MLRNTQLTADQAEAVFSDHKRICIIAGAGSGKTLVIVQRIARLIREGTDPATICVVTFTNAAGREIARRLAANRQGAAGCS